MNFWRDILVCHINFENENDLKVWNNSVNSINTEPQVGLRISCCSQPKGSLQSQRLGTQCVPIHVTKAFTERGWLGGWNVATPSFHVSRTLISTWRSIFDSAKRMEQPYVKILYFQFPNSFSAWRFWSQIGDISLLLNFPITCNPSILFQTAGSPTLLSVTQKIWNIEREKTIAM